MFATLLVANIKWWSNTLCSITVSLPASLRALIPALIASMCAAFAPEK
jgi:hypothetical protein